MPASEFSGRWSVRVDSGPLEATGSVGGIMVDGEFAESYDAEAEFGRLTVRPGSRFRFRDGTRMSWSNPGDEPTVLFTLVIIDEDHEPILWIGEAEARHREASVNPFKGEVVKRLVLRAPDGGPCDHKLVIRDLSGQLLGARIPNDDELRFLGRGEAIEGNGIAIGPVVSLTKGHEVLVSWLGTPCGPTSRIEIGKDVAAIRVENLCACDSAGATHSVVLRLEGGWTDIDDVEGILKHG